MGYIDSKLSLEEQARVLARLNQRRSEVARGIRGLPTAGNMLKLVIDLIVFSRQNFRRKEFV